MHGFSIPEGLYSLSPQLHRSRAWRYHEENLEPAKKRNASQDMKDAPTGAGFTMLCRQHDLQTYESFFPFPFPLRSDLQVGDFQEDSKKNQT